MHLDGRTQTERYAAISALQLSLAGALDPESEIYFTRHLQAFPRSVAAGNGVLSTADACKQRHLMPEGWHQAHYLGTKLASIDFDLAVSTAAWRAVESMQGIFLVRADPKRIPHMVIAKGNAFFVPNDLDDQTALYELIDSEALGKGELRYGRFAERLRSGFWENFQVESLRALPLIPGLAKAKRLLFANHGMTGSPVAEALLGAYTGGVVTDDQREFLREVSVPLGGVLIISKKGVELKTYI